MTQFNTVKKKVREIVPGDVVVSSTTGARMVTAVTRTPSGGFIFHFGLPRDFGRFHVDSPNLRSTVDSSWSESEFEVVLMDRSFDDTLRAQLKARDAALNAVVEWVRHAQSVATSDRDYACVNELGAILMQNGIH